MEGPKADAMTIGGVELEVGDLEVLVEDVDSNGETKNGLYRVVSIGPWRFCDE